MSILSIRDIVQAKFITKAEKKELDAFKNKSKGGRVHEEDDFYPDIFYPLFFEQYGTKKFKEYYAMGADGLDAMNYYLMTEKTATLEDMYFYKVWNEYRMRKSAKS